MALLMTKDVREPASCYYASFTQDGTPIGITVKHHGNQNGGMFTFLFTLATVFGLLSVEDVHFTVEL